MFNAQRLYLKQRILFKLSLVEENLQRSIDHLNLLRRLQSLMKNMNQDLRENSLINSQAMKEKIEWIALNKSDRLKTFKHCLMSLFFICFNASIFENQTQRDTFLWFRLERDFEQHEMIAEKWRELS